MRFTVGFGLLLGIVHSAGITMASSNDTSPDAVFEDYKSLCKDLGLDDAKVNEIWDTTNEGTLSSISSPSSILTTVACLTAQAILGPSKVDTPPINTTIAEKNWSKACVATPGCIIQPKSAKDVSVAIQIIRVLQVKFAVRSGGHSPNPGWSSIDEKGILIDLANLASISLSTDKKVASIGPGARWGAVYAALDPDEAVVIGGRFPDVGVGGLILGGGYFHISSQYGLACDNIKNFEVVLSDGRIVNANASENKDLYWALRGGGPNFGVVTRFDLYTVPAYKVWGEISVYSADQAPALIKAFDEWQKNGAESDPKSSIALNIALDSITVGLIYAEPQAQKPSVFDEFNDIQPLLVAVPSSNLTFNQVSQILAQSNASPEGRHDYRALSTRIDTDLTLEMYEYWREKALAVRQSTGANQTWAIQHVSQHFIDQTAKFGGNPTNISPGPQQWWTTLVDWTDPADDETVRGVAIDTTNQWAKLAKDRNLDLPFLFMNDASRDQNPLASYGTQSLTKLKAVSVEYDKKQVFQRLQVGGFRLSQA